MPIARINGKLLHFVHIPKTGGANVTSYMRTIGQVALYSREPLDWARTTPQHMEMRTSQVLLPRDFVDARFMILRNPLERMLSEFRYRYTRLSKVRASAETLGTNAPVTLELDWDEEFHGTFDEWVELVLARYELDPFTCDNHIRPQSHYFDPEAKVFLFENGMEPVLNWIDNFTGVAGAHFDADRNASLEIPIVVSPRTRALIEDFYAEDYRIISCARKSEQG